MVELQTMYTTSGKRVRSRFNRCGQVVGYFACASLAAIVMTAGHAMADIDLSLVPVTDEVFVGDVVEIQVIITSDSNEDQLMSAMQMIFAWDTEILQLLGQDQTGGVNLLSSGFPNDPYGINESNPPKDGLGLYQALAPLGDPVAATPDGTLLTTLIFEALEPSPLTWIEIVPSAGDPEGHTIIFDGTTPNTDVTGVLTDASVTILHPCPWDLNDDGFVNVLDFLILLNEWGQCDDCAECPADFGGDCAVNVLDFLILLSNWGPCPQ